jgi:hypothetical protein
MRVLGKKIIQKLKKKNVGNRKLTEAIDLLVNDLERFDPQLSALADARPDADCVHSDGFYFFDIHIHRTLIMIELEDGEATIILADSHDEYVRTFKNNRSTIEKWLRSKNYID